jgi:hypothetical protein
VNKSNPLPQDQTDENLAESFVDYFFNKITTIREKLDVADHE